MRITLVLLSILMIVAFAAKGQIIDISKAQEGALNISAEMQVLEDPDGRLSFEDLPDQPFVTLAKPDFIFPFTSSVFWLRIEVVNNSSENEEWILNWGNPLLEELIFYEYSQEKGEFVNQQLSNLADDKEYVLYSKEPSFGFLLVKGEAKTFYLRLESKRGHYGTLNVYSAKANYAHLFDDFGIQSFLNGLLIFRLLLIIIISFFVVSDKLFRAYSAIILIKTIGFWGIGNITGPIFSNDPLVIAKINQIIYSIMPFSILLFALQTLPVQRVSHWVVKSGYTLIVIALCVNLAIIIDYQWYWVKAGMSLTVIGGFFIIFLYLYFASRKLTIHKYYSIPLLIGLGSNMLIMLRLLVNLDFNGIYALALLFFVTEIIVFIIFLGKIFRQIEKKKLKAEQGLLLESDQNRRLQELDRLKTSFFTDISHELRTPLTLMQGPALELLKKNPGERLINLMVNNLTKLRSLVDELLDIQKLEAKKMIPEIVKGDVPSYLRLLVDSFSSLAESKEVDLSLEQNREAFAGCYDEQMLLKIINNLMSNALKFTPKGGYVKVEVLYAEDPELVKISVKNSGQHIDEEHLPLIFDRFYKGSNGAFEGTGIGLALVKELTTVLKGDITIESEAGKDTTFLLSLPLGEEHWSNVVILEENNAAVLSRSKVNHDKVLSPKVEGEQEVKELVLIVEDNAEMREYISLILSDSYTLIEAENGLEGVAKAKELVPDLIVCDAMMPVMDGYQFSREVKNTIETSHVPIIMLTAKTSKESKIESYEQGVDNYLTKPFDADELKSVLNTLLMNRKKVQQVFSKEVFDLKPAEVRVNSKEVEFLYAIKTYLEKNYSRSELNVTDIAAELKVSDTQLRRKLKSITGLSPNEYLRKFRLEKAAYLLKANASSVSEIAYEIGYESLSYFSKVFQKEYGCLPSEYADQ